MRIVIEFESDRAISTDESDDIVGYVYAVKCNLADYLKISENDITATGRMDLDGSHSFKFKTV